MGRDFDDLDFDIIDRFREERELADLLDLTPIFWEIYGHEDMERLFEYDQLDLLHRLPDTVPDDVYDRLEQADERQLVRHIEQEERKAGRGGRRRLFRRRPRAEQSPTL